MSKQLSFVWLLLLAPVCLQGQSVILLRHANVIDGLSDQPIRDATVLVENGQIRSLGPGFEKPPSEAIAIDLAGRWLLPGLIDAHVHLVPDDPLKLARAMVDAGVTTIRTMGASSHFADVGIRELHRQGAKDLPEVVAAGYQIRPDIAVAAETFLLDFPQLTSITRPKVSGPDNVRRLVQANVQHGVNLIKVLATERAGTPETDPRQQTFTEQEMVAIVDEARKSGLPVAAHAHGDEAAAAAVSQRPHRRRTWAPRGQTPVVQFHFNWKTLSPLVRSSWQSWFRQRGLGYRRFHKHLVWRAERREFCWRGGAPPP